MKTLENLTKLIETEMFIEFSAMYFWLGFIFYMAFSTIEAGINNVKYKIKLIKDYERIIANNCETYDMSTDKDKKLVSEAKINHKNRLNQKNKFKKRKENKNV